MKELMEQGATSDKTKIAKRLRETRDRRKLTQAALAERAGLSRSAVVNYENEKAVPGGIELIKLARALSTTPNYLLSGAEEFRDSEKVEHFLAEGSPEEQIAKVGVFLQVLEPPTRNAISALIVEMVRERLSDEEFAKLVQVVDALVPRMRESLGEIEPTLDRVADDVTALVEVEPEGEGGSENEA